MKPGKGASVMTPGRIGIAAVMATAMVTAATATAVFGQAAAPMVAAGTAQAVTVAPSSMTEGEIRKVDRETGKITIRHGPIANLEMPAMTMVFRISDPAMLDRVKEGAKVRFLADRVGGALTVTQLEPAS